MNSLHQYGEMIIPKDSIIYHTSDEIPNNTDQMLFCTFHPSEWIGIEDEYVSYIKLLKDVRLVFVMKDFQKKNILSFDSRAEYKDFLKNWDREKYDGFFSSIENKPYTQIVLYEKDGVFEVVKKEELKKMWRNSCYDNLKNWGTRFLIAKNISFILPLSYQEKIDKYIKFCQEAKRPNDYVFEIIIQNSKIDYV